MPFSSLLPLPQTRQRHLPPDVSTAPASTVSLCTHHPAVIDILPRPVARSFLHLRRSLTIYIYVLLAHVKDTNLGYVLAGMGKVNLEHISYGGMEIRSRVVKSIYRRGLGSEYLALFDEASGRSLRFWAAELAKLRCEVEKVFETSYIRLSG